MNEATHEIDAYSGKTMNTYTFKFTWNIGKVFIQIASLICVRNIESTSNLQGRRINY